MRLILMLLAFSSLAACQTRSIGLADKMELARIPSTLKEACRGVVDIPSRDLRATDVAKLWATDRQSLGECARRHGSLVRSLEQIEGQGK